MASKRKHSTLTLKDKLEVLKRLDKGEGVTKLATEFNVGKATICDWRKNRRKLEQYCDRQQSKRCTIKLIMRFIFGLPRKEDGKTAEFLTDDDIAAAVTQEPMEEEGSDDETQCDKKDVVPHADGAAALDLATARHYTS
ncbi:hypothetical protein TNCV_4775461 [Trichonephila clavipes]|nr:hypothetical protein TNCV_4775461 [Trichonephila clavipes]